MPEMTPADSILSGPDRVICTLYRANIPQVQCHYNQRKDIMCRKCPKDEFRHNVYSMKPGLWGWCEAKKLRANTGWYNMAVSHGYSTEYEMWCDLIKQGLTFKQIAAIVGRVEVTVRSRMERKYGINRRLDKEG